MSDIVKYQLVYRRESNVQPRVSHGVYGGVTPSGTIEMEFFTEASDPSGVREYVYDEAGVLLSEENPSAQDETSLKLVRTVHTRLLMSRAAARNLMDWLSETLADLDGGNGPTEDMFDALDPDLVTPKSDEKN